MQQISGNLNMICDGITEIKYGLWMINSEGKEYVIKRLLPKLNVATLWCISSNPSVFLPEASLNKLLSIGIKYSPCLPIFNHCNVNCLIVMEKCQSTSSNINFDDMLKCLARQDKIENVPTDLINSSITRETLLNEINYVAENNTSPIWCEIGDNFQVKLLNKLKQNRNVIRYGLCYGKNYLEHAVKKDDTLFLLPSETIFLAEWGFDFAELITEYYMAFNWSVSDYMKSYYKTLETICISIDDFLVMCLCSLVFRLIKYKVLSFANNEKLVEIIIYLLHLNL